MNNLQSTYKNFLPLKVSKYKGLLELAKKYVAENKIWFYNKTRKHQTICFWEDKLFEDDSTPYTSNIILFKCINHYSHDYNKI